MSWIDSLTPPRCVVTKTVMTCTLTLSRSSVYQALSSNRVFMYDEMYKTPSNKLREILDDMIAMNVDDKYTGEYTLSFEQV